MKSVPRRSVTELMATLQELEHLGVGFVSVTEARDLTTPAGRAMAALLAVFAEFEREILRERVRAGPGSCLRERQAAGAAWKRRRGMPPRSGNCIKPASANPKSPDAFTWGRCNAVETMPPPERSELGVYSSEK